MIPDHSEPDSRSSSPSQLAPDSRMAWHRLPLMRRVVMAGGAALGAVAVVYAALAGSPKGHSRVPHPSVRKPVSVARLAAVNPTAEAPREPREALVESVVRSQK
jgi:hypothetical protein